MMKDSFKPCIVAVEDVYEMHSLASKYPIGTIYIVDNENKCYISCGNGGFTFYDSVATTPVEEAKKSYPDEDTYRI